MKKEKTQVGKDYGNFNKKGKIASQKRKINRYLELRLITFWGDQRTLKNDKYC